MSSTELSAANRLSRRQTYRRLMFGCILVGVVVGLVLRQFGYPLAGEGVYWLGILGFFAVWKGTSMRLFDERDRALERRASLLTLQVVGAVLVLGASSARVLAFADIYTAPPVVWHVLSGFAAVFAVFAAAYLWVRYR